jgi:hypothetical protein
MDSTGRSGCIEKPGARIGFFHNPEAGNFRPPPYMDKQKAFVRDYLKKNR